MEHGGRRSILTWSVYDPIPCNARPELSDSGARVQGHSLLSPNGHGRRPFPNASMSQNILSLQILFCVVAVPLMFLSAVMAEATGAGVAA